MTRAGRRTSISHASVVSASMDPTEPIDERDYSDVAAPGAIHGPPARQRPHLQRWFRLSRSENPTEARTSPRILPIAVTHRIGESLASSISFADAFSVALKIAQAFAEQGGNPSRKWSSR
jgi:hypothetical protein